MTNEATTPNGNRIRFEAIDATAFQHPLDRQATENLKKLVGFDLLVAKFLEFGFERLWYVYNIASAVRVGPKQFPTIYGMLRESCAILDLPEPELYVIQAPMVNAFTNGHTKPYIMLYTGLLELLDEDEIMNVVAHELGHIKCGHVLYSTMANLLGSLTLQIDRATFGLGLPLYMAILAALVNWRRLSEYSADRAGLLVMQNPRPVITTLTKFAGGTHRFANELDPDEFLQQARIYTEEIDQQSFIDRLYRILAATDLVRTHPFTVERVKEIDVWANGPEYADIMTGNYPRGVRRVQIRVQAEA